jgi:hypothetical protein
MPIESPVSDRVRVRGLGRIGLGAIAVLTCALLVAVTVTAAPAAASRRGHARSASAKYRRCGFTSSPYGRLGIYIGKGKVGCKEAESLIHRSFYVAGEITHDGDLERYPGSWYCGGQMGAYTCSRPSPAHPHELIEGLECNLPSVGCPDKTRY